MVSANTKKKVQQVAFIGGVALLSIFLLNTLAKRFAPAKAVADKVAAGF